MPKLLFSEIACEDLQYLQNDPSQKKVLKAVLKTLGYMETNLRHPSLNAHIFYNLQGPNGEKVFEVYAQQNTPGAYRIFWYYGPGKDVISIIGIVPHP
jgi:hypothetical protein